MKLTLLGTGTSQGVPVIGCECNTCLSPDPRDQRLRTSALIRSDQGINVLIDAGPDFRQQMLREKVKHLDAILLTHEHNDHVIGLDDIRPFNHRTGKAMNIYALQRVADEVKKRFEYIFAEYIPGLPRIELIPLDAAHFFTIGDLNIQPIGVMHGRLPILGFRFGNLAYLTDAKYLIPEEKEKLRGLKHLIVNALQHDPHPTHMNLNEALDLIAELAPEKAYLLHMGHNMGRHGDVSKILPANVTLAHDGLEINF